MQPLDMLCPITLQPFKDPVVASDGFTYERSAIVEWMQTSKTSPMNRETLNERLVPNRLLLQNLQPGFWIQWRDAFTGVRGREVFSQPSVTAIKLLRRLGADTLEHKGQVLDDDALLPFGHCLTVWRFRAKAKEETEAGKNDSWGRYPWPHYDSDSGSDSGLDESDSKTRDVQVQLGSGKFFLLSVDEMMSDACVQEKVVAELRRRGWEFNVGNTRFTTTPLTTWQTRIAGPELPVYVAAGCHMMEPQEQMLFSVTTPYLARKVLLRAAGQLRMSIDSLTLRSESNCLHIVIACKQPATIQWTIQDLRTKTDILLDVNPEWTVEHLKHHLFVKLKEHFLLWCLNDNWPIHSINNASIIGKDDSWVITVSPSSEHFQSAIKVRIDKGCRNWPRDVNLWVAKNTSVDDVEWQVSQLARRPLEEVVVEVVDDFLMVAHLRCLMPKTRPITINVHVDATTPTEVCLKLDVGLDWLVSHLKRHLALRGHPTETPHGGQRRLWLQHNIKTRGSLCDALTLADSGASDNDTMFWMLPLIKVKVASDDQVHTLSIAQDAHVAELQRRVICLWSCAPEDTPRLFFQSSLLALDKSLRTQGIKADSLIHLVTKVCVSIRWQGSLLFVVATSLAATASQLLHQNQELLEKTFPDGLWSDLTLGVLNGSQIAPDQTLGSAGVRAESKLELRLQTDLLIYLESAKMKKRSLEVCSRWSIAQLKVYIQFFETVPLSEQRLVFAGQDLADYRTIESFAVPAGAIVHLIHEAPFVDPESLCIFVRVPNKNATIILDTKANWTIQQLKTQLEKSTSVKPERQKLFFSGKLLSDFSTVAECQIQNHSTLFSVL